jgi:hypothetical protein
VKITSFKFKLLLNGELRQGVIAATARTELHFSNANQHLIIENQYFSNAE